MQLLPLEKPSSESLSKTKSSSEKPQGKTLFEQHLNWGPKKRLSREAWEQKLFDQVKQIPGGLNLRYTSPKEKSDFKAARQMWPEERKPFQWNLSIASCGHIAHFSVNLTCWQFYPGKLEFRNVTDFSQVNYLGQMFSIQAWICQENNRISVDSYPSCFLLIW